MDPQRNHSTALGLRWSGHTDAGKVRANNEDAFLGLQFDAKEAYRLGKIGESAMGRSDLVFAVSDGMGGAMAGEYASRITTDKIIRLLPRSFKQSAVGLEAGFADVLEELFDQVHRALSFVGGSYAECFGMQATLSLCWFTPGWMYFGHIGDSRIYYLPAKEEGIKQLTHDDTHVGWLFRNGKINEWESRNHPRRTVLQKALGADNQFVEPQVGAVAYETGDRFLLCTDGLVDGLFDQQINENLRLVFPPGQSLNPAQSVVQASLGNSGRDNTTAIVIEVF